MEWFVQVKSIFTAKSHYLMIQLLHNSTRLGVLKIIKGLDYLTAWQDRVIQSSSLDNVLILRSNTFYGNNYLSNLQNVFGQTHSQGTSK